MHGKGGREYGALPASFGKFQHEGQGDRSYLHDSYRGGQADYAPCTEIVSLDFQRVAEIRRQLPLLTARREDLYQLSAR